MTNPRVDEGIGAALLAFLMAGLLSQVAGAQTIQEAYQRVWDANQQNLQRPPQSPQWFDRLDGRPAADYDSAMINCIAAAMNVWAANAGPDERAVCEDIIGRVAQRPEGAGGLTASVLFAAAQAAEIVGAPDKTTALLSQALDTCGSHPAPGAEQVTVDVAANMWMARLAYNAGRPDEAIAAYQNAAQAVDRSQPALQEIRAWCMLYEGEIYGAQGNTEAALNSLSQVDAIMAESMRSSMPHLQSLWAQRLAEETESGASETVAPARPRTPAGMAAELQGKLNGTALKPLNGIFHETDRNGLFIASVKAGIGRNKSSINNDLSEVCLGELHLKAQRWEEAESVFSGLYQRGAFLAPYAGMRLAECLANLGRSADAARLYKDILQRWPAYGDLIAAEGSGRYQKTKDPAWQNVVPADPALSPQVVQTAPLAAAPPSQPAPAAARVAAAQNFPPSRQVPPAPAPQTGSQAAQYTAAAAVGIIAGAIVAVTLRKRSKTPRDREK